MTTERWQELILGGAAILWGAILFLPNDTLGSVQRYAAMSKFLPDFVWGALLIASGIILVGLTPYRFRKNAHALIGFVWGFIVVLAFLGGFTVGAVLVATPFAAMALLHIFEYFRLSQLDKL